MVKDAPSFPVLIRSLLELHHPERGLTEMAARTGIVYQTLHRWDRGLVVTMPAHSALWKLARAYEFDVDDLYRLLRRDLARRILEQPVEMPDLTPRKRGPRPIMREVVEVQRRRINRRRNARRSPLTRGIMSTLYERCLISGRRAQFLVTPCAA